MTQKATAILALILSVLTLVYAWTISRRVETALRNNPQRTSFEIESSRENSSALSTSSPAYIANVYANKSGMDGLKIRIRLRDDKEAETAANGILTIIVADKKGELLTKQYHVHSTDFKVEEYYLHDRLMFSLPRITFSEFSRLPTSESSFGKVAVVFEIPDGRKLVGANDNVQLLGQ
jgi:hypothetical protein